MRTLIRRNRPVWAMCLTAVALTGCAGSARQTPRVAEPRQDIVFGVGSSAMADPLEAGKAAARAAKAQLGSNTPKAVIVSECYEDRDRKEKVLAGVCAEFPSELVYGNSTYGSFTQQGVVAGESIAVLVLAGSGLDITAACQTDLGVSDLTVDKHLAEIERKLIAAGESLARKLPRKPDSRLMLVYADAHSPKNGALVKGLCNVAGNDLAITGGSANKNAGQTFVYYQGRMLKDSAVAVLVGGDFRVSMAGRQAKDNDRVVATAREGAAQALEGMAKQNARPAAILAFDCAGRKGKLKNVADELAAIRESTGDALPVFGSYNAGEIGPPDVTEPAHGARVAGVGWHVMFTCIGW